VELEGKVALVTGAARGIGRGIALALARAGCDVAVSDRAQPADGVTPYALGTPDDLEETRRAVAACGRRSVALSADVSVKKEVEGLVAGVEAELGGLDVLVANAGIVGAGAVAGMDEALWDRIFAVNVKGVFLCAQAAIPHLARRGAGRIVTVASIAGKTGRAGLAAYCASKAAVISLTQALAEELGPLGITVNAVCPGFVDTAMFTAVLNPLLAPILGVPEAEVFEHFVGRATHLRRPQTPADIGEAVVYLCRADNVTGIALNVAGGAEVH
jgi:meso-butanediol dehydrogenase/(S,S)-butanediol dehydrogenase/diacetyl reductase